MDYVGYLTTHSSRWVVALNGSCFERRPWQSIGCLAMSYIDQCNTDRVRDDAGKGFGNPNVYNFHMTYSSWTRRVLHYVCGCWVSR